MAILPILSLLVAGQPAADSGYLTVKSNMAGLLVFLEGDALGRAPIEMHKLAPGEYMVSIVSDDSLETVYWRLRQGKIGAKLSSVWTLAALNAGTHTVDVRPGRVTEVFIDYGKVANAPREAKFIACGATGGLFLFGAVVGFLIGLLAFGG